MNEKTDIMFKVFSLVVLTLVLDLLLCSSAPISAKAVQVRGPRPEEPVPVTEDARNLMEEKEPDHEKLPTAVPGQAAPFPDEAPAEENMFIAKEPERTSSEDHCSDDADELASQEPLAQALQESETVSEEAAFVESSPDTNKSEQHHVEDTAPESLAVIIPEDDATEETAVSVETASPEDQVPAGSIPVVSVGGSEDGAPEEPLLMFPDDKTEEETAALPMMLFPEEYDYIVLVPAELEREEASQWQIAAEGSAPEEHALIVSADPAKEDLNQEETVLAIVDQNGDIVEPAAEQTASQVPVPEDLTLDTEKKGQVEPAAEETSPVPEEPDVIESTSPILIIGLEGLKDDAPEYNVEVDVDPSDTQETALVEVAAGDSNTGETCSTGEKRNSTCSLLHTDVFYHHRVRGDNKKLH